MIVVVHDFYKVTNILGAKNTFQSLLIEDKSIGFCIYTLAEHYPLDIIVWCHEMEKENINNNYIKDLFPFDRFIYSFNKLGNFLTSDIGFIEETPFININKAVKYPTWQMSSVVGVMKGATILMTSKSIWESKNSLDYILTSIAKIYMPLGLFCYSDPKLLLESQKTNVFLAVSKKQLFLFIARHYKWVWKHLLLLNLILHKQQFAWTAWLAAFFVSKTNIETQEIDLEEQIFGVTIESETIDVIIPTIGRKKYLYDVLKDLSFQTHLPKNVIIVEQNPDVTSVSDLDFITSEQWPFQIKHLFTHQTGACQARNKALDLVESKWVFLNDDDNRFDTELIENCLKFLTAYNLQAVSTNYLLKNEKQLYKITSQTTLFGSGNSIISSEITSKIKFDLKLEFGYGEDTDYGMQLRNQGYDIIYNPNIKITHLKAPIGGFRTKFVHPWENETLLPKPSPTIMYVKQKYLTKEQLMGYKTRLFLKLYTFKIWKLNSFIKQWKTSEKWAKFLKNNA